MPKYENVLRNANLELVMLKNTKTDMDNTNS
jgi:hypothetical protein